MCVGGGGVTQGLGGHTHLEIRTDPVVPTVFVIVTSRRTGSASQRLGKTSVGI